MPYFSSEYIDNYSIKPINISIFGVFFRNILTLNIIRVQKPQKQATVFAIYSIY
jgi:hypothetical protein